MMEPLADGYNLFMGILEVLPLPFQLLYSFVFGFFAVSTVINVMFRLK